LANLPIDVAGGESLTSTFFSSVGDGLILAIPVACLFAYFERAAHNKSSYSEIRREWASQVQVLQDAFYCLRDDLVFGPDGAWKPESFQLRLFNYKSKPRIDNRWFISGGSKVTGLLALLLGIDMLFNYFKR
jgi:hypothetical protein